MKAKGRRASDCHLPMCWPSLPQREPICNFFELQTHKYICSTCALVYTQVAPKVMPPIYFHRNNNKGRYNTFIKQVLSYKMLFLNMVTTIFHTFLPAMNKSLHGAMVSTGRLAEVHHILRAHREETDKQFLLSSWGGAGRGSWFSLQHPGNGQPHGRGHSLLLNGPWAPSPDSELKWVTSPGGNKSQVLQPHI